MATRVLHRRLWRVDRQGMALGLSLGLAVAMLPPAPIQTVAATTLAILCRANVPLAAAAVWVSNPLTWWPLLRFQENLGRSILFGFSDEEGSAGIAIISSLTLGVVLSAAVLAVASYCIFHCVWGIFASAGATSKEG
ncbi:MAG: DUF2062 domain-containing protein [Verrucomicrobiales bacterium]